MSVDDLRAQGWVKEGAVWRNPGLEESTEDTVVDSVMDLLANNFASNPLSATTATAQRICSDCGCLVLPGEHCPACRFELVSWCERAAAQHSWRPIPYVPEYLREVTAA